MRGELWRIREMQRIRDQMEQVLSQQPRYRRRLSIGAVAELQHLRNRLFALHRRGAGTTPESPLSINEPLNSQVRDTDIETKEEIENV